MKNTKVIAAFPACGKTYYFENREENNIVLDSDSSKFSWMFRKRTKEEKEAEAKKYDSKLHFLSGTEYVNIVLKDEEIKVRNPDFPKNYVEHIKENIGKADYIFVSTHDIVIQALKEAGIDFTIVFPEQSLKAEWIGRCFLRGSNKKFCQLIADQWDNWIVQMEKEVIDNNRKHYRLKHGQYLSDAMKHIG